MQISRGCPSNLQQTRTTRQCSAPSRTWKATPTRDGPRERGRHGELKVGLTIREGAEGARLCDGREMTDARSATKAARALP